MNGRHPDGNKVWTRMLLGYFRDLAARLPASYDRQVPDKEWLLDMCWTNGRYDSAGFRGITLAVESEGDKADSDVLEELNKLLAVNAPSRVLIYSSYHGDPKRVQQRRGLVRDAIEAFGGVPSGELTAVMFADAASDKEYWCAYCDVSVPACTEPRGLVPIRCMRPDWRLE